MQCAVTLGFGLLRTALGFRPVHSLFSRHSITFAVLHPSPLPQFTLLCMTYEARMSTLRHFVRHYSRCPSVSDIVLVWNNGEAEGQPALGAVEHPVAAVVVLSLPCCGLVWGLHGCLEAARNWRMRSMSARGL